MWMPWKANCSAEAGKVKDFMTISFDPGSKSPSKHLPCRGHKITSRRIMHCHPLSLGSDGADARLRFTEISGHQCGREIILANTSHLCGTPDQPSIKGCVKESPGSQAAAQSLPVPHEFHWAVWGPIVSHPGQS